jgi:hypothetical protein
VLALHQDHTFSDLFLAYLLERNIRYEEDLLDQLFSSSEKRLARTLFGKQYCRGAVTKRSPRRRTAITGMHG